MTKFLSTCLLTLFSLQLFAQKTIPLNRHFYEISKDDKKNKMYSLTQSQLPSGEQFYLIFDSENRRIRQIKVGYNTQEKFNQELTDTYDTTGRLISQTLLNLDTRKSLTIHFDNSVKKGQVIKHAYNRYEMWREGKTEPYFLDYDDFQPEYDLKAWEDFLAKNLTYPTNARMAGITGTVYLALLVSESGELLEYEVANAFIVDQSLAKEALRVLKKFNGTYKPALDLNGKPKQAWLYLPISFNLGR